MTKTQRVCNHCMWFGPVNANGTMRKHRALATVDRYGYPKQVPDRSTGTCPGSNHTPRA